MRMSCNLFVLLPVSLIAIGALVVPANGQSDQIWTEQGSSTVSPNDPIRFDTIRNLAENLSPAVVSIYVSTPAFGYGNPSLHPQGEGTGFIINSEGYILTNNHVVDGASVILIRLQDDREYYASVVGTDPRTDIALLRVETDSALPVAPLGDSDELYVGDWVVAIGSPLGLDFTVTAGIVSALGRRDVHPDGREMYEDFIQTDASINPGNSGGPLINLAGQVIGINTAINRLGEGIGFAIPINMVKVLIPQLLESGTVVRSCIGVSIQPLTSELAMSHGLERPMGALVTGVVAGEPGDEAGLVIGDVILVFDGVDIEEAGELPWLASIGGVGVSVPVDVLHNGSTQTISVTLGEQPCNGRRALVPTAAATAPLGIRVAEVDPATRTSLGLPPAAGVSVVSIESTSPAVRSGLRTGDIIIEVDSMPIASPSEFARILASYHSGRILRLRVRRGNAWVFIAFTL